MVERLKAKTRAPLVCCSWRARTGYHFTFRTAYAKGTALVFATRVVVTCAYACYNHWTLSRRSSPKALNKEPGETFVKRTKSCAPFLLARPQSTFQRIWSSNTGSLRKACWIFCERKHLVVTRVSVSHVTTSQNYVGSREGNGNSSRKFVMHRLKRRVLILLQNSLTVSALYYSPSLEGKYWEHGS